MNLERGQVALTRCSDPDARKARYAIATTSQCPSRVRVGS